MRSFIGHNHPLFHTYPQRANKFHIGIPLKGSAILPLKKNPERQVSIIQYPQVYTK